MKIIIARQELAAAMLFASTDDTRYVLTGIQVIVSERRDKPVVVATDGRRLTVIETIAEQEDTFDKLHDFILRPDFVKPIVALSKAFGGKLFPWIRIETKPGSKRIALGLVGNDHLHLEIDEGALIEGVYPDWQKVMPSKRAERQPISELGINSEFVGDFAKAAKLLEARTPVIQMNLVGKESQVEVKLAGLPNFYGLVMQCKLDDSVEYQPEFTQIVKDLPKPEQTPEDDTED